MKLFVVTKTDTNYMNGTDAKSVNMLGVFTSRKLAEARVESDIREFVQGCYEHRKVRKFTELADYAFDGDSWAYDSDCEPVEEEEDEQGEPIDFTRLEVYEVEVDALTKGVYIC